jgi:light-regulated signal transduction histidine kinase (bacteriophytochrome)
VAEPTHALELANIELEAFSYAVSYDLRAPLRSVEDFSGKLEKEYASRTDEMGAGHARARARGRRRHFLFHAGLNRPPPHAHRTRRAPV